MLVSAIREMILFLALLCLTAFSLVLGLAAAVPWVE